MNNDFVSECNKDFSVILEYCGEGYRGDYDPSDPCDVQLLRYSVFYEDEDGEEQEHSYCTLIPADTDERELVIIAGKMIERFEAAVERGESIKRVAETLSAVSCKDDIQLAIG